MPTRCAGTTEGVLMSEFAQLTREPSLAERVNSALMKSIASGALAIGDRLPSERALCEQFGVSRTVIREAVRGLQAKGVVQVRHGRGVEIVAFPASHITEAVRLFAQGATDQNSLNAEKISEVRRALELRMVEIACKRATDDDIAQLRAAHEAMSAASDLAEIAAQDVAFHQVLAASTHNIMFVVLLDSVGEILMEIRQRSLQVPGRKEQAITEHGQVLEAVTRRDVAAAHSAMEDHLSTSESFYTVGRDA